MKPPGTILKNFLTEREEKKIKKINPQNCPTPTRKVAKDRWFIWRVGRSVLLKPGHQHPSPTYLLAEEDAHRQTRGAVTRTMCSTLTGQNSQLPPSPPTAAATESTAGPGEMD